MEIVSQYFKTVPSNPHYFFYCPPSSKKEVSWQSYVLHFPLLSCVSARLCVHISLSFTIKMSVGDYIDRKRKWFWNWKWKNIFQTTGICVSLTKEKSNLRDKWIRCEGDLCIWKPIKIHKCQLWLGKRNNSTIPTCILWLIKLDESLHCGSSPQEDSEDGETGRRPSEDLVSEAEPATEDGEDHSKYLALILYFLKLFIVAMVGSVV